MKPLPTHRIAIESRSGIWILFYETLFSPPEHTYKQQLLRIFFCPECRKVAEAAAICEKIVRNNIDADVIIRDDSQRNVMLRKA